jgi:hypothetical protein
MVRLTLCGGSARRGLAELPSVLLGVILEYREPADSEQGNCSEPAALSSRLPLCLQLAPNLGRFVHSMRTPPEILTKAARGWF